MIEENVVAAAGVRNQCDVDEMVRLIRAAGLSAPLRLPSRTVTRRNPIFTRGTFCTLLIR